MGTRQLGADDLTSTIARRELDGSQLAARTAQETIGSRHFEDIMAATKRRTEEADKTTNSVISKIIIASTDGSINKYHIMLIALIMDE